MPGGGHTKLPPTRTFSSEPRMSPSGPHSQSAGGLSGEFWTASSRYPAESVVGEALEGGEVMVKPPALGTVGT